MSNPEFAMLRAILFGSLISSAAMAQNPAVSVRIDASADVHAISPLVYGVSMGSLVDLRGLNAPLNRSGGDNMSTYSYANNAQNLDRDYYYESYPQDGTAAGAAADDFVRASKAGGGVAMLTVPMIGWVAKLGPDRSMLPSFSVAKYGAQCDADPYRSDAGSGQRADCVTDIVGNDPNDAYIPDSPEQEGAWISHLVQTWGGANAGGAAYYLMDNEPSLWFLNHRDVHPEGLHAEEYSSKVLTLSAMIKAIDPSAQIVAPEEWGWRGFIYSGYDQQYATLHRFRNPPDHAGQQGGMDYVPWLLTRWKAAGHPVDVLGLHYYPQGGEFGDDVSEATQLLRNRSTRELWDPNYTSESWIKAKVALIPRMRGWIVDSYYPGTPIAITEYNWGAEAHINGATAQADILGIFGVHGLSMATRWTVPAAETPTYKAMQMYRNYDGRNSTFGETSVAAAAPDPDRLAAFASLRASDGAMTVMVISKVLSGTTPLTLLLANFPAVGSAQVYRLTASASIDHLPPLPLSGATLVDDLPPQSITLYVLSK